LRELEELERQAPINAAPPATLESLDPNFRQLRRVIISKGVQDLGNSDAFPLQPLADNNPQAPVSERTRQDGLDIPDFLLRQEPEPKEADAERKIEKAPLVGYDRGGNVGNGGGNGGGGNGGGGGGDEFDEECKKKRKEAKEICIDAFANGFALRKNKWRWKSNYNTGPFPNRDPKLSPIDECAKGIIGEACGGGEYIRPPKPKVKRYRLR
jgi:hypothetical protein